MFYRAKFSLNLFVNDCSTIIYTINNDITSILDITAMKTQRGENRYHRCFGSQELHIQNLYKRR